MAGHVLPVVRLVLIVGVIIVETTGGIGACCDEAIFEEGVEDYYQVSHSGTVAGHVFKYYLLLFGAEAGVSVYEVL